MSIAVEKELPKGWSSCKIDDVCKIIRGITFPKTAKTTEKLNDHIPCLRTTNVQESTDWKNLIYIPSKYVKDESKLVKISDILISNSNSLDLVGKVSYVDQIIKNSTFGGFITIIRSHSCDSKYLFYQLRSSQIKNYFRGIASTTTNISNISTSKIADTEIFLPPLNEQKRIVAKIEELFSLIDSAKDTLEKTQVLLKQYRQSILKHAFEGKLTAEWRENNQLSFVTLKHVTNIIMGQSPSGESYNNNGDGVPLLNGPTEFGNKFPTEIQWTTSPTKICKTNDLLFCVRGNTIGRMNWADKEYCIGRGLCAINSRNNMNIQLVFYFLSLKGLEIRLSGSGSTFPSISKASLENFKIPLFSNTEQESLLSKIEENFLLIEKNEKIVDQLLLQCNQIKNSILKQAFEGKLVPQDPNDEPAEILLQRIREEKNGK